MQYIGPFPLQVFYLIQLFVVIAVVFLIYKRPIYEAMAVAYIAAIVMTGRYDLFMRHLLSPSTHTLFYAIVAFLLAAHIFDETKVVARMINFVIASVGRFHGGAGYAALIGSTFMGTLSGSGAGNVAATGVFTIPAMIATGFPRKLAATVEMACSTLGNVIPPAGVILLSLGVLEQLHPGLVTSAQFILIAYGIGFWFVMQRWLTLVVMCKYWRVKPVPPEDRPSLKKSWEQGKWVLLIPVLIFLPLFLDAELASFVTGRLGREGARAFTRNVLLFTPAMAGAYALWIGRKDLPGKLNLGGMVGLFRRSLHSMVPVAATIYLAFSLAGVFGGLGMGPVVQQWFLGMGLNLTSMIFVAPIFFMFLGMVLPGSAQIALLGSAMTVTWATLGGNPVLFASMLPAITGAMEGMTPPLAIVMYTAMGIAKSGFVETTKITLIWVALHLLMSILLLSGLLPIFGLVAP